MTFTGQIGNSDSTLGNVVLGIYNQFGLGTIGFIVHQFSSDEIRVVFDRAVTDSALNVEAFDINPKSQTFGYGKVIGLSILSESTQPLLVGQTISFNAGPNVGIESKILSARDLPNSYDLETPLSSIDIIGNKFGVTIPFITSVSFYDADQKSVLLKLSTRLKTGTVYTLNVYGVSDFVGQGVTGSGQNFVANVQDPPRALHAFTSKRGCIDVIFDRSVGLSSPSCLGSLRDSNGGPSTSLVLLDWHTENIPSNTLRFSVPATLPVASSFLFEYTRVLDEVGNSGEGTTPLTLKLRSDPPYNHSSIYQMQFSDAYVLEVDGFGQYGVIRVFFNCPADSSDISNQSLWTIEQEGSHVHPDSVNSVTTASASDLATLIVLTNSIKSKFNSHLVQDTVHKFNDNRFVTIADSIDLATAINLLSSINSKFIPHRHDSIIHSYSEDANSVTVPNPTDLSSAILFANTLKSSINGHFGLYYPLQFISYLPTPIGPTVNRATYPNVYDVKNEATYFVDLNVNLKTIHARVRLRATIHSQDGGSYTSTIDFSGDITSRSAIESSQLLSFSRNDDSARFVFDKIINNSSEYSYDFPSGDVRFELDSNLYQLSHVFNNLLYAYNYHLSNTGHAQIDTINGISNVDYITSTSIYDMINRVNSFRSKFDNHVTNSTFHYHSALAIAAPVAVDELSLKKLLFELIQNFESHESSGQEISPAGVKPTFPGYHLYPGPKVFISKIYDILSVDYGGLKDDTSYSLSMNLIDIRFDPDTLTDSKNSIPFSTSFIASSSKPSLSAITPINGLIKQELGGGYFTLRFEPDHLLVFFSKSMNKTETLSTNISLSGSILPKIMQWENDRTLKILVSNMTQSNYTLTATGLSDLAGNQIY